MFSLTTEMTPKIDQEGRAFSLRSRDYKDPQCICIEGNGSRESHRGDGFKESETMYTLNTVEQHAIFRKQSHPQNAEQGQGWEETQKNDTLNVYDNSENRTPTLVVENHPNDSRVKIREDGKVQSLTGRMGTGGGNVPMLMKGERNAEPSDKILCILQETYGAEAVKEWGTSILVALQQTDLLQQGVHESSVQGKTEKRQGMDGCTLPCTKLVTEWLLRNLWKREEYRCTSQRWKPTEQQYRKFAEIVSKLPYENTQASKELFDMWEKGEGLGLLQQTLYKIQEIRDPVNVQRSGEAVVRRLTPLECMRLQGYPDHWVDIGDWVDSKGKLHKDADSPKYKALGNSIALPFWKWMAERMVGQLKADGVEEPTMASLFDGIGGFPLSFSRAGCKPVWASEIEEFPIAVTKLRFPEGG